MKNLAICCARAFIAFLAILPALSLRAEQVALAVPRWTNEQSEPRVQEHWIEEWDPVSQRWVRVALGSALPQNRGWQREWSSNAGAPIARFGPFLVTSETIARLIGSTDSRSPAQFEQMMAAYPRLRTLSFVDASGTTNDIANLRLGRMIRASGLTTHIPSEGSARSGAVELFLAGAQRIMEPGALFAVHSWVDSYGREPRDFGENDPANRLYIDYYVEMGMSEAKARAFYAMTNSVPHSRALWFGPEQMGRWIGSDGDFLTAVGRQRAIIVYRLDQMQDPRVTYGGSPAFKRFLTVH